MQDSQQMPPLGSAEVNVFVGDMARARDFYVGKLGFDVVFMYGEPAFYGQVRRDAAVLNLRLVCAPVFVGDVRERERLLAASITVAKGGEIDQVHARLHANGVRIVQAPRDEPWGARTLIVADPDGNLILFAAPRQAT